MRQIFTSKCDGNEKLLLIFAGWGMDERLSECFDDPRCDQQRDVCVCYDYRELDFDAAPMAAYCTIDVVAWSMGVWAAAGVLPKIKVHRSMAVNGTHYPIDEQRGIAPAIFAGTLDNLSEESIRKFWRRMCSNSAKYAEFMEHAPQRTLLSLGEELSAIRSHYRRSTPVHYDWDEVVVGSGDRIFTPTNQLEAWGDHKNITVCEMGHLPDFNTLMRNE